MYNNDANKRLEFSEHLLGDSSEFPFSSCLHIIRMRKSNSVLVAYSGLYLSNGVSSILVILLMLDHCDGAMSMCI